MSNTIEREIGATLPSHTVLGPEYEWIGTADTQPDAAFIAYKSGAVEPVYVYCFIQAAGRNGMGVAAFEKVAR